MLYVKAFHIIFMVTWFAGLFYLPRLFVYHADAQDLISQERFKVMERRLYYGIIWPGAVLTTVLGFWLVTYNFNYYLHAGWLHAKLACVLLVWSYHFVSGHYARQFKQDKNVHSSKFYRIFNELPTLLLVAIVLLVVVKP